ncbi:MAG: DNA-binding response regulator [Chloroflexi bacterium]|nr:DNA-binding response regulator [Chloroflexota bacterium]|tara:strand:- start:20869 stop:21546 length:678 start_codon:yes stop_codon:yes gene_type:complete
MSQEKLLIIEDEINLQNALKYYFEQENYAVDIAQDGELGLSKARGIKPSIIILDLMLPKLDGLEFCRIFRKESDTPIIMLTAKGSETDKVLGLEMGADDYLVKPFAMRELLARVRALLRRKSNKTTNNLGNLISENLKIDLNSHITTLDGENIDLSPKEFLLLKFLIINKGKALSRNAILDEIWGKNYIGDSRTVDVHIRWIRKKINSITERIRTIRGVGYRFEK